jgi:Domain of unknown function (DUF4124)
MRAADIFLLLLLLASAPAGADMFKWTDAGGNIQYGQHPPPGVPAERLKSAPAPQSAPAPKSLQQQVDDMNRRTEEQNQRKAEAEKQKQAAANRKMNCEIANRNIEQLNSGGNRLIKMPDGSYQRLDEKTRQAQIEKNQKAIKEFCD